MFESIFAGYQCATCGATGIKLWRQYQTVAPSLFCATCACADQKKLDNVDDEGRRSDDGRKTDQIGWLVPAVPDVEGIGFWGYSSVPDEGVQWWRGLPTRV